MNYARLEIFTVMKFYVMFFWVITPCSDAVGHQCFRGPCCLYLHPELWSSKTRV